MQYVKRDYQIEAIEAIKNGFKDNNRATAVMACGTGKTLVALWVAESIKAKTIVVYMLSLMLIKQTVDAWNDNTEWDNYSYMAICCDNKLLDDDIIDIDAKDCCFDVCTNADQVRMFMENGVTDVKIVFSTYQSSNIIPKDIKFDLGIFDEAHKTAHKDKGAFRYALYDENASIAKRLFLTATPRHYQLRGRSTQLEYSMNNEEIYGPIVYRLDFAQAIHRGIICDYRVLITLVNDKIINDTIDNKTMDIYGHEFKLKMLANAIALKQTYRKFPIRRTVAFHRTIKETREFTKAAMHSKIPDCHILDINGHMSSDERKAIMASFEYCSKAIISNARCLSEGVDIPSIDLVAFLSPKKSKIDIIQAIGRVMRKAPGKEYGYILLPIYVTKDMHAFNDITDSSEYAYIMEIINSLREYDTDLQQQISDRHIDKEKYGKRDRKIQFINTDISEKELTTAIDIDILSRFKDDWEEGFAKIKKWYEQNGSWVCAGTKHKYNAERGWINWQRTTYKKGILPQERIDKLRSINFVFDATDERYEQKFEKFKKLVEKVGLHKTFHAHDLSIDNWFQFMKRKIIKGIQHPILDRLLQYVQQYPNYKECMEYKESRTLAAAMQNLAFLQDYHNKHGHINVRYNENEAVAKWLDTLQKGRYRDLKPSTKQKLINMGFVYRAQAIKHYDVEWDRHYNLLLEYKKIEPDLIFHKKDKKWRELNRWAIRQRDKYRKANKFLPGHREKLIAIGLFKNAKKNQRKRNAKKKESARRLG